MLDRRTQGVRTAFKWAAETSRIIDRTPFYGDDYHKSSAAQRRASKRATASTRGERRFTAGELATLINSDRLKGAVRAMVWLGLNGGMYSQDCADLRWDEIKKEGGLWIVDTFRKKTEIRQRFVLWPETMAALNAWRPHNRKAKDKANEGLVFLTRHGAPWVTQHLTHDKAGKVDGGSITNGVSLLFGRLLDTLKIHRHGIGFGAFRHTHVSAAARCSDANARHICRGHKIGGIEEHYDFQDLDRLKAVTDTVYAQLIEPVKADAAKNARRAKGKGR